MLLLSLPSCRHSASPHRSTPNHYLQRLAGFGRLRCVSRPGAGGSIQRRLCADIALAENNNRKTRVGYSVQTGSRVLSGIKPRRCSKILRRGLSVGTSGENNRRRQSSGPKLLSFSQEVIDRSLFGRDRDSIPRFDCEQRLSS